MNPLEKLRNDIIKRIEDYEKSDRQHVEEIYELNVRLKGIEVKRNKVQELLNIAKQELKEIDEFAQWKINSK
jgi:geranylgeranyl pyrophosphate synthase